MKLIPAVILACTLAAPLAMAQNTTTSPSAAAAPVAAATFAACARVRIPTIMPPRPVHVWWPSLRASPGSVRRAARIAVRTST